MEKTKYVESRPSRTGFGKHWKTMLENRRKSTRDNYKQDWLNERETVPPQYHRPRSKHEVKQSWEHERVSSTFLMYVGNIINLVYIMLAFTLLEHNLIWLKLPPYFIHKNKLTIISCRERVKNLPNLHQTFCLKTLETLHRLAFSRPSALLGTR